MANPEKESRQTVRIIDASLNLIGEGLRFSGKPARIPLNTSSLNERMKDLRAFFLHYLPGIYPLHRSRILKAGSPE
jgi:hypothetical protein